MDTILENCAINGVYQVLYKGLNQKIINKAEKISNLFCLLDTCGKSLPKGKG